MNRRDRRAAAKQPGASATERSRFVDEGLVHHRAGRLDLAKAKYLKALAERPGDADAQHFLGLVLHAEGRHVEAVDRIATAVASKPKDPVAQNSLGLALAALGDYDGASRAYRAAIALQPAFAQAHNNLACVWLDLGRYADALQAYDRALAIKPDYVDAWSNRGNALCELMRFEEALASYGRALAIDPDYYDALSNRAAALIEMQRHEAALKDLEQLRVRNPNSDSLLGPIRSAKQHCCDWRGYSEELEQIVAGVIAGRPVVTPFIFLTICDSPAEQLKCAQIFFANRYRLDDSSKERSNHEKSDKIRVAYLSADFHRHATAYLVAGLFEAHDRDRFETIAISFGDSAADDMRTRLENAFSRFIDVRAQTDREVADLLKALKVDIAVDLKGYTRECRPGIFASRPAPIQVNFLGYPGTLGAQEIDYIIADRIVIPEDQHPFYVEKVVYLPDTYQPNDRKRRIGEITPTRQAVGLPPAGFVFCSFNHVQKITPGQFDIWMRLLRRVEGSVLWLLEGNAASVRNLRSHAQARGVTPDRLVFAPYLALEDHLARYRLADLFLDSIPFNAHTTASDALWVGVPVVTCLGRSFAARVAGSLLHAVGLPELATENLAEYEALAFTLATEAGRLAATKAKLMQNRQSHPLFDTDRFRRHLESAYETMWSRHYRGESPVSFAVAPADAEVL